MTVTSRAVVSPHVVNIDDLRDLARRRVPRIVFDYIDGGADGEIIWKVSLYFYAAMFFVAAISWLFVDPQRVIVYADATAQTPAEGSA
jgi:hypothetical protein